MSQLTGRQIGPYVLGKLIGEGGMSVVYQAVDTRSNEPVALKLLSLEHSQDRNKVERFWRGAQSALALQHPNIVRVYDANLADGYYYIAMQYLEGGSVEDLLINNRGPMTLDDAARLLTQVAAALDYAHSRQVIHRDIKPSNILLSADHRTAYLADFGIARITGQETVTEYGKLIGTPEYMSPEQIQGKKLDPRADIYSLGITAYHMLTGTLPFEGAPASVLYNQVHTTPPPLRSLNRAVPRPAVLAVNKAVAKAPEDRYSQATGLSSDLAAALAPQKARWPMWAALGTLALFIVWLMTTFIDPWPETIVTPDAGAVSPIVLVTPATVVNSSPTPTSTTEQRSPTSTAEVAVINPIAELQQPTAVTVTVPTVTPAVRITPATDTLVLNQPEDGAVIPRDRPLQTFSWNMSRPLESDESYEIRMMSGDGNIEPLIKFRESTVMDDFLNRLEPGSYRWQVVVVRTSDSGEWLADVIDSTWFDIVWGQ